jgi:preprotein translocase subunit YajC
MSPVSGLISVLGFIGQTAQPSGAQRALQMLPIVLIFVIFYFLLIRPQQKRQKEHQKMLDSMTKGDRVLTSGGMFGVVVGIDADKVVLKIAENVKAEFSKASISHIVSKE